MDYFAEFNQYLPGINRALLFISFAYVLREIVLKRTRKGRATPATARSIENASNNAPVTRPVIPTKKLSSSHKLSDGPSIGNKKDSRVSAREVRRRQAKTEGPGNAGVEPRSSSDSLLGDNGKETPVRESDRASKKCAAAGGGQSSSADPKPAKNKQKVVSNESASLRGDALSPNYIKAHVVDKESVPSPLAESAAHLAAQKAVEKAVWEVTSRRLAERYVAACTSAAYLAAGVEPGSKSQKAKKPLLGASVRPPSYKYQPGIDLELMDGKMSMSEFDNLNGANVHAAKTKASAPASSARPVHSTSPRQAGQQASTNAAHGEIHLPQQRGSPRERSRPTAPDAVLNAESPIDVRGMRRAPDVGNDSHDWTMTADSLEVAEAVRKAQEIVDRQADADRRARENLNSVLSRPGETQQFPQGVTRLDKTLQGRPATARKPSPERHQLSPLSRVVTWGINFPTSQVASSPAPRSLSPAAVSNERTYSRIGYQPGPEMDATTDGDQEDAGGGRGPGMLYCEDAALVAALTNTTTARLALEDDQKLKELYRPRYSKAAPGSVRVSKAPLIPTMPYSSPASAASSHDPAIPTREEVSVRDVNLEASMKLRPPPQPAPRPVSPFRIDSGVPGRKWRAGVDSAEEMELSTMARVVYGRKSPFRDEGDVDAVRFDSNSVHSSSFRRATRFVRTQAEAQRTRMEQLTPSKDPKFRLVPSSRGHTPLIDGRDSDHPK